MKKTLLVFLIAGFFLFFNYLPTFATDPGIPDTVRFLSCGSYVSCPPCTGRAVVPMYVVNDEPISDMFIPLEWTGEIYLDTALFVEERFDDTYYPGVLIYNNEKKVFIANFIPENMPPGQGVLMYIYFTVQDTGLVTLDLTEATIGFYHFADSVPQLFQPPFFPSEFHIVGQSTLLGDLNQDGLITISDVVYFINYLFKSGPPPPYLPSADVNTDSEINVSDVIYFINYLFKNGPSPGMGCYYSN